MIEEGQIVEINGQRYLVVSVGYGGGSRLWVKDLELKGIKGD